MRKVTFQEFKDIKKYLWIHSAKSTANKFGRHLSTIINIKGSPNYIDYEDLVKSEHPETKDSLKEKVLELHAMMFRKPGVTYFAPPSARKAVLEMQVKVQKDKRAAQ